MTRTNELKPVLDWLEWFEHNQGRAVGSVNKYLVYLQRLAEWLDTDRACGLLDAEYRDLEDFCGIEAHKAGIAPISRRPVVAAIRGFYRWASGNGLIPANPAERLPYPSAGAILPRGMTLSNANKLIMAPDLDTFIGIRDLAILSVFMGCGLRLAGLVRLNQSDLLFNQNEDGRQWLILRVVEKGDRERLVPAPPETRYAIRAYLAHPDMKKIDRTLPDGNQVLFVSTHNQWVPAHEYYGEARRLSTRSVAEMIEKYGERQGIPRDQCHPHALRHLYGTELTEDDVQQRKIQVLLGHADIKSTARYQQVAMRALMAAVEKSNPLAKMKTPLSALASSLDK